MVTGSGVPPFAGKHLWVYWAAFQVINPGRVKPSFDPAKLLTATEPGCYYCEQLWTPTIGATCPGVWEGEVSE